MHDPRVGRFFTTDPLESTYPYYSPYSFSGNKVIHAIELEGLEEVELFHRTTVEGAAGIFKDGFDAKFTKNGKFHFFRMTESVNGVGRGVANAPVDIKVKLDITNAKTISKAQYRQWFKEALAELNYNGPKKLPKNIHSQADAIRNQKLWNYMRETGEGFYKIITGKGKGNFIAATDDILKNAEKSIIEGESLVTRYLSNIKTPKAKKYSKLKKFGGKVLKFLGRVAEVYTVVEIAEKAAEIGCLLSDECPEELRKEIAKEWRKNTTTIGRYDEGSQKALGLDKIDSAGNNIPSSSDEDDETDSDKNKKN